MQPVEWDGLSRDQIVGRIGRLSAETDCGVDLLDADLRFVRALDMEPAGSKVTYTYDQAVRMRARLVLAEPVDWGTARLRPWASVGGIAVRMGVYRPSLPANEAGTGTETWTVDCYDLTADLNRPHGATVRVAAGGSFLAKVTELLAGSGLTVTFGGSGDAPVSGRDRIWPLDRSTVTLDIVNELLEEAGYRPLFIRWDGTFRGDETCRTKELGTEWTYTALDPGTTVGPVRRSTSNRLDVPNRLVAISGNATAWDPIVGDGVHIVVDQASIDREGVRTAVVTLEAVTQAQLVEQAVERFDELNRHHAGIEFETLPNPFHFHQDVVRVIDTDLGLDRRFMISNWTYHLDGSQMQLVGEAL